VIEELFLYVAFECEKDISGDRWYLMKERTKTKNDMQIGNLTKEKDIFKR